MNPSVVRKQISDQNGALNTSFSTYYPWRDSSDSKLRWLWARGQVTGISWPDCSDAGMVYWLVMGRGSDDKLTPSELLALFSGPTEPPPSTHPAPKLLEAEPSSRSS